MIRGGDGEGVEMDSDDEIDASLRRAANAPLPDSGPKGRAFGATTATVEKNCYFY